MSALERHAELLRELKEAERQGAEAAQRVQVLERAERVAGEKRAAAYATQARGLSEGEQEVKGAEEELIGIRREAERERARVEGARRAVLQVRDEIAALKQAELAAFTEASSRLSDLADEKREAARAAVAEAQAAWARAHSAWTDINVQLREAVSEAELAAGRQRGDHWLAQAVHVNPWNLAESLQGQQHPRPLIAQQEAA